MSNINFKNQRGVAVLYVVFITSILLAIGFGTSEILVKQIKMLGEIGYSVISFYAADSGIELTLTKRENPLQFDGYTETFPNGASYQISVISGGTKNCASQNYCIKSIGSYRKTKRAIQIDY